jgi:trimeric autotransporter adhesin
MSSISGVGTSGLYQYFPSSQSSQTGAAQNGSSATSANSIDGILTQGSARSHGKHQHKGSSETNSLGSSASGSTSKIQQLQNAVVSALQSSQSNAGADPNQTVTNAIASIFKNSLNSSSTSSAGIDGDSDSDSDSSTTTTTSASTQQGDFSQTLQDYGINSQQFQQDFQNAVQQSQGGQVDPSAAFRSFPPGLIVDTTA